MDGSSSIERGRRIKLAAELGLVRSARARGRHWGRSLGRRLLGRPGCSRPNKEEEDPAVAEKDDDEEAAAVERRVRALQRLIPGGEEMPVDRLLEETADYIEALQGQVSAMRALATLLDGLEDEKRIKGG